MRPRGLALLALVLAACRPGPDPEVAPRYVAGDVVATTPVAWRTVDGGPLTVGLRLRNTGPAGDVLLAVRLADGPALQLHEAGPSGMTPLASLELPAGADLRLGSGGPHIMTGDLPGSWAQGDTLDVEMEFEHAGRLRVPAPVLQFTEARRRLGP